jgi:hypothetical protein
MSPFGLLSLSLSSMNPSEKTPPMRALCMTLFLMRAVLFLTRSLSLSHRDRKRKSETSKSKRSDEFPTRSLPQKKEEI